MSIFFGADVDEDGLFDLVPTGEGPSQPKRKEKRYFGDTSLPYTPIIKSSGGQSGGFSAFCETTGGRPVEPARLAGTHGHSAAEVITRYNTQLADGPSSGIPSPNQRCNDRGPIGFNPASNATYREDARIIREHPNEHLRAKASDNPEKGVWFTALRVGDNGIFQRSKKGPPSVADLVYVNDAPGPQPGLPPVPEEHPSLSADSSDSDELQAALDLFKDSEEVQGGGMANDELHIDGLDSQGNPPHESSTTSEDLRHGIDDLEYRRFLEKAFIDH
jgi:hypothetical protein